MHSRRIREKVKEDYNRIAEAFSETRQHVWKDFDRFLPYYAADFSVLDLGCGNGRLLKWLEEQGVADYLGVDQAEGMIEAARELHPGRDFEVADMALFETEVRFDAVFAMASFHHLGPKDQLDVLRRWRGLLKPGGYLFMTNWNLWQRRFWKLWPRSFMKLRQCAVLVPWKGTVERYYYAFTKRRLARLLKRAGFEVLEQDYVKNGNSVSLLAAANILTVCRSLESK